MNLICNRRHAHWLLNQNQRYITQTTNWNQRTTIFLFAWTLLFFFFVSTLRLGLSLSLSSPWIIMQSLLWCNVVRYVNMRIEFPDTDFEANGTRLSGMKRTVTLHCIRNFIRLHVLSNEHFSGDSGIFACVLGTIALLRRKVRSEVWHSRQNSIFLVYHSVESAMISLWLSGKFNKVIIMDLRWQQKICYDCASCVILSPHRETHYSYNQIWTIFLSLSFFAL